MLLITMFFQGLESGVFRTIRLRNYKHLSTKELFEMPEPQPLGYNNVMFCFISLGFGICLSVIKVITELMTWKISKKQTEANTYERNEMTRWATTSTIKDVQSVKLGE